MAEPTSSASPRSPWLDPPDEHNLRLVENVHPAAWVNPRPAERYHLVVVGGGTAGLVAAAGAAGLGARVALVERALLGGDCLNYGCVPSKALVRAARAWHDARRAAERFGAPKAVGDGDFGAAMARLRRLRADLAVHDSAWRFARLGVDVFLGHGRFVASDAVEVEGARLHFRRALIATGGRPAAPPIPGLEEVGYLTNETVFSATELPRRLAVVGAGPIGCELAQAMARFGSRVTLLDVAPQILPREDAEAAAVVARALAADGVELLLGVQVAGALRRPLEKVLTVDGPAGRREVPADELLVATGRKPNVEALGLEAAGVEYGKLGVEVDDRLRTTNRRIYAAGDVAGSYQFTHAADAQARIVLQNALFFGRARASRLVMPWCTYTSPEVAHVGLYEHEARRRGIAVETLTIPLSQVDRAVLDGAAEGFLRIDLRRGTDRILGATLVAESAGELLGELCLAATHGIGLGKITSVVHPYPTQAEVIKKAADAWRRGKLTAAVARLFGLWFRIFR